MKSKPSQRQDALKTLAAVHKDKAQISKHDSEKKLHYMAAEGFEKAVKTNAKLANEHILVPLQTLSKGLLDREAESAADKKKISELETIMWEGRYCDYLAKVLAKVKSSSAWQAKSFKTSNWIQIRDQLVVEDDTGDITKTLFLVSKELGFPVRAMRSWICIYAARCASGAHHSGFANLFKSKDIRGLKDKFLKRSSGHLQRHSP